MCLSIEVNYPETVLSKGEHEGIEFVTVHNGMGYRCGYARIPKGHPWHCVGYDSIPVEVHGGLTFADMDTPCQKGGEDDAYWIGFDCAHCFDAPDPSLPFCSRPSIPWADGIIRTQAYVDAQCRSLCEQIAKNA